jgi:hypothetical protein
VDHVRLGLKVAVFVIACQGFIWLVLELWIIVGLGTQSAASVRGNLAAVYEPGVGLLRAVVPWLLDAFNTYFPGFLVTGLVAVVYSLLVGLGFTIASALKRTRK